MLTCFRNRKSDVSLSKILIINTIRLAASHKECRPTVAGNGV